MSNLLMLSTLPYFKKQCVVVPVSITSTKLVFLGTISRVVLTFNLLGLTTLDIDTPPPQFAGPDPQGFCRIHICDLIRPCGCRMLYHSGGPCVYCHTLHCRAPCLL